MKNLGHVPQYGSKYTPNGLIIYPCAERDIVLNNESVLNTNSENKRTSCSINV